MSEAVEKKQSAFDKIENLLNTYLGPVAEKMDNCEQDHWQSC